jgi:hypothetical protein
LRDGDFPRLIIPAHVLHYLIFGSYTHVSMHIPQYAHNYSYEFTGFCFA